MTVLKKGIGYLENRIKQGMSQIGHQCKLGTNTQSILTALTNEIENTVSEVEDVSV